MIVAVIGPSGAGKDTLLAGACARRSDLRLARRVITRAADVGGEDYDGVDEVEFAARRAAGAFALEWQAHGLRYAVPWLQLEGPGVILFNGSRAALSQAFARFPDLRVLMISAPPEVLAARLASRGREAGAAIGARLDRASLGVAPGVMVREVVNDGTIEVGVARLLAALDDETPGVPGPDRG